MHRSKHRRKRGAHRSRAFDSFTVARDVPVAPNNVGPKTIPNYDAVAAQAIETLKDGTRIFAGQRDDPFFVDLGATFDSDQPAQASRKRGRRRRRSRRLLDALRRVAGAGASCDQGP